MSRINNTKKVTQEMLMTSPFQTGDVWVNFNQNSIRNNNNHLILQPKVLELLILLCVAQGETLSKESLIKALWPNTVVGPDSLANTMARLRKALDDDAKNPHFIQTVQRKGYRWLQPINLIEKPSSHPKRMITVISIVISLLLGTFFWLSNKTPTPNNFLFPELSIKKLDDGGYEVQVAVEGKLTEERKVAMLAEIKRITGEEHSGMIFTVDPIKPNCQNINNKNKKNHKESKEELSCIVPNK
jgi:DNA-binding winged helix-turn-helix (wHTH) protein